MRGNRSELAPAPKSPRYHVNTTLVITGRPDRSSLKGAVSRNFSKLKNGGINYTAKTKEGMDGQT